MRSPRQLARFPLALLIALALTMGCEDSGVIAPSDGQMILSANPSTVVIDDEAGETEGQSTITAQLFDAGGYPLQGVDVAFTTSSGSLASSPPGGTPTTVETDASGIARDVLTLTPGDDESVEVEARSGTLSATVAVTLSVGSDNTPPTAVILAIPDEQQQIDDQVRFSGAFSSDPDGDITCFKWTLSPAPSGAAYGIWQGTQQDQVSVIYSAEEIILVTLRVSDDPDAATWCATTHCEGASSDLCGELNSAFNGLDQIGYEIVCDLSGPVAAAGPDQSVVLSGGQVDVQLDGSGSRDPDSGIVSYSWQCGNGTGAQGEQVTCTYTAAGTYTARLTITNGCDMTATDDVRITVSAP